MGTRDRRQETCDKDWDPGGEKWKDEVSVRSVTFVIDTRFHLCVHLHTHAPRSQEPRSVTSSSPIIGLYVEQGDWVERGQALGGVGCTDAPTGTHLHFEARWHSRRPSPLRQLML
ncbi:MAG TPA: M23 family metallopeptidase [Dehalococcoidia bacterium]|nr:M23 family metallopeptidase [Dehalococcoidia bacterium]